MFDSEVRISDQEADAVKFVSGSEAFALGHFPDEPIYPGVLSLDLMVELGRQLAAAQAGSAPTKIRVARAQYLNPVRPGDALAVHATVHKTQADALRVRCRVSVDEVIKTRATLEYHFGGA